MHSFGVGKSPDFTTSGQLVDLTNTDSASWGTAVPPSPRPSKNGERSSAGKTSSPREDSNWAPLLADFGSTVAGHTG